MIQASKNITIHARRWSDLSEIAKVSFFERWNPTNNYEKRLGMLCEIQTQYFEPNECSDSWNEWISLKSILIMRIICPVKHSYYPLSVEKRLLFIRKVNRGIQKSEQRICFEFPARAGNLKLIPRLIFWTPKRFFWKFSQARIVLKNAFFEFLVGVRLSLK